MTGLQKKRVSWASDVNLCQVRMFLSEESPSQVGLSAQDHLQAKASWLLHSNGMGSDDSLPPGFEGAHPANQLKSMLSQIPVIKWKRPPMFVLNATWQVVCGEESREVELQNQREMRVLEAVYPRPSAIPPNPSVSMDIQDPHHDERQAPLIPITPVEDEDAAGEFDWKPSMNIPINSHPPSIASEMIRASHSQYGGSSVSNPPAGDRAAAAGMASYDWKPSTNIPINSHPPSMPPEMIRASHSRYGGSSVSNPPAGDRAAAGMALDVEPDVAAAASAAFTAIMKSNEQGNMIDHELLIKILNNPKLIEKLVTDYGASPNPLATPSHILPPVNLSNPPAPINRMEAGTSSSAATASEPFYAQPNGVVPSMILRPPPPPPPPPGMVPVSSHTSIGAQRDFSYYKNLIQQHGGERQETTLPQFGGRHNNNQLGAANQESINNPQSREWKPRIMKPCIYFNSSRGCRHGANCSYQHDASLQQQVSSSMPDVQSAKRMKMDREITGT